MHKVWRILSIDGGGIRGIIPALILARLEELSGKPTAELFDVITGASVGGILAMAVAKQKAAGQPAFKAAEIADLFIKEGPHIFHNPASWIENVMRPKYSTTGLERFFDLIFAQARLKELLTDVLIPCYDIGHRCPYMFRSRWARRRSRYDLPIRVVARATSAAPTLFTPAQIQLPGNQKTVSVVDGGVFANNPAMHAYIDAKAILAEEEDDFLVVSLGAGESNKPLAPPGLLTDWGFAHWSRPIMELICASSSEAVHAQMKLLLPPTTDQRYYRFQMAIPEQSDDAIDNVSKQNIDGLIRAAHQVTENQSTDDDLRRLAVRLLKLHGDQGFSQSLPTLKRASDRQSDRRVFICCACDEGDTVAQPLAAALSARGLKPTFGHSAISPLCSIRRVITEASKDAPYGIIILSPKFLSNEWAEKQVSWLFSRLIGGENLLLAIAHGFTKDFDALPLVSKLNWHFEAQTSLEGIMELIYGNTGEGIEPLADRLTEEIINWYK